QLGADERDLLPEELRALRHLLGFRIAVAGGAAFEHVGDVDVLAALETDRGEYVIEELARLADERLAEPIFFRAGRFADQHPYGFLVADAEHGLRSALVQAARGARGHRLLERDPVALRELCRGRTAAQPPERREPHLRQHVAAAAHRASDSTSASSRPLCAG